jgi:hypothetical protein
MKKRPPKMPSVMRQPTGAEAARMADAADRVAKRGPRIQLNVSSEDGVCQIGNKHADGSGWQAHLTDAFGTTSQEFAYLSLMQMINAVASREDLVSPNIVNAVVAAVDGVRPNTEIEAMLACQMTVTHAFAMDLLGRANRAQHVEARVSDGSLAVKLLRTYTAQVEALAKLQRGGAQTVRVEHVHVHAGGQAVVGNIHSLGGGGLKGREQPHAVGYAPSTPMPSADTSGHALPVACDEEWPLSDARRPIAGGSEGK